MEQAPKSANQVVQPIKMPKMKISGGKVAALNAFALSFAAFFGFISIFAAIAGFTNGDWMFGIPLIGLVLANVGFVSTVLITSLLAVIFAIIGLITVGKISDASSLTRAWGCVSKVFLTLTIVYVVSMVAMALYSLMGVGKKSGVSHEDLWLSNFLPNVITAVAAGALAFFAKQIESGKTMFLRILSFISIGVASVGFILVVIQTLVGFYAEKSSSSYPDYEDYSDIYDDLMDLYN